MISTQRRSRGITEQDVWQAADALLLAGQRPTIERIRQQLGRGSPNTVSPHLDAWFAGLGARLQDPHAFAGAPALPEPVNQAAQYLWEAAMAQARAALAAEFSEGEAALQRGREALAEEQVALEQERAVLTARLEFAEQARAELARSRDEATDRARQAEQQAAALRAELDAVRASLAEARLETHQQQEAANAQREAADGERALLVARFDADVRRLQRELDASRQTAREGEKRLEEERAASRQRLQQLAEAERELEGRVESLARALEHSSAQIAQQQALLEEYRAMRETQAQGEAALAARGGGAGKAPRRPPPSGLPVSAKARAMLRRGRSRLTP